MKVLSSLDSSRKFRRLIKNPKPGSSRELFLPENCSKTCHTVYFPYLFQFQILKDMKFIFNFFSHVLLHTNARSYENCLGYLMLTSSKFWRQNLEKRSAKKAKKLNFIIFEVYISWIANPRKIIFNRLKPLLVWY